MAHMSPARKKARLAAAYLRGYPIWVSWQVTYTCNFRCRFCSYWKEEVNFSREAREREDSVADFRQGSEKLAQLGSLLINMAGGEPFMRRDLPEITAALARWHFPMVTTNGWLVTEANAKQMWDAGLWGASVSLDFSSEEKHDANRGMRGAAIRAKQGIEILSRTRTRRYQRVNLMCVLNDQNLGEIEDLIRFAAANKVSFMVQPYASVKSGIMDPVPTYKASAHLLALKRCYPNFVSSRNFLSSFDRFYEGKGIAGCRAGRAFFNIDNFMNVQKCVEFRPEPVGNLRTLEAREMVRLLGEENRRNLCKACWYNCRGEVEGLYTLRGLVGALTR